jgi:hypothetical protein
MKQVTCRFCKTPLARTFVDLGIAPMVSNYLKADQLHDAEQFYSLRAYVCEQCFLVQLPDADTPEHIFGEYPYFSSVSKSWLDHARKYVEMMVEDYGIGQSSQVVEIASNDGYLLQYFKGHQIPIQGVEPARNIAAVAESKGIPTLPKFFGRTTAQELVTGGKQADLIIGNNVLAHVPDINDFVAGLKVLLKPSGMITMEFPHLLRTIMESQFDQVFHEHASYLSLVAVERILAAHELVLFDVQELSTHGGSIRIFAKHANDNSRQPATAVSELRERERAYGLERPEAYDSFRRQARETKYKLLSLLIAAKQAGHSIVGYGAPGKGCVMLNYCGIGSDFLDYLVDLSPAKQGLYIPGVRLPIYHPDKLRETKPKYVLILPWNLRTEIMEQLGYIRSWGGKFIVPIPEPRIIASSETPSIFAANSFFVTCCLNYWL